MISARNEAGVIGELIHTLKQQNYPTDLLVCYVVADNCTDDTAQVSRRAGAIVYERFNQHKKGKGYAWITYSAPWPTRAGTSMTAI